MEMQSVLTQMTELVTSNSAGNSQCNQKVEGKSEVTFQNYMTKATKQNEAEVSTKQEMVNETNMTVAAPEVEQEKTMENLEPMETLETVLTVNEVEKDEFIAEEFQIPQVHEANDASDTSVSKEIAHEWKEEVQEVLCEEFNLTLEELESIMSELGLQFVDLQNLSNIQQFVLTVEGINDKAALLTNEVLAHQVVSLQETLKQITTVLMEEYELDSDEIADYLTQDAQVEEVESEVSTITTETMPTTWNKEIKEAIGTEETKNTIGTEKTTKPLTTGETRTDVEVKAVTEDRMPSETENQDKADKEEIISKETTKKEQNIFDGISKEKPEHKLNEIKENGEKTVQENKEIDLGIETKTETVFQTQTESYEAHENPEVKNPEVQSLEISEKKETVSRAVERDEERTEPTLEVKVEKEAGNLPKKEKEFSDSDNRQDTHTLFEHFVENLSLNRTVDVEKMDMKLDVVTQMREIVTQIVEAIKVRVGADTSSMEVQLNPESLGKVNLTVVAKEGHVTAQFVTENELARQALESQVQQLRENLGEQGLKVDEVEVTVSNFDFSHSNQANAEEQRQQHSQGQRKLHRNLNLKDAVKLNDLTEEEQLAARIMADNGNQVDYTA